MSVVVSVTAGADMLNTVNYLLFQARGVNTIFWGLCISY